MARTFICRPDYPVADTANGKIRGFELDDIFIFRGIRYAVAERFMPARLPEPWEGIKDATNYGPNAPTYGDPLPSCEILIPHGFWPENEACQYLNIWTASLDPSAKKPVVVWFHGGGFANGSALEQVAYEGDALCGYGDVVVVTVNHRLNILGYLDVSSLDEKYANSVNAGITDLVVALQWIHENISAFGGDPENVTIFGQSGGGGKVCTLLQTPAADGLYHKAMIMSGSDNFYREDDPPHAPIVEEMLAVLNIPRDEYETLTQVPYRSLMKAYIRACNHLQTGINWGPVANDYYLGHPCDVGFRDYAKTIPTIVGNVIAEFGGFARTLPVSASEEEKRAAIRNIYGSRDAELIEAFQAAYPGKDLSVLPKLDYHSRPNAVSFLTKRAESGPSAPGYSYQFSFVFDVYGGTPAWHCSDIPFIFHNTARVPVANLAGVTDRLEDEMAGALISFAYTGNPNHRGMPRWMPFTAEGKETMFFDAHSECRRDADTALMAKIAEFDPAPWSIRATVPKDVEEEQGGREWLY